MDPWILWALIRELHFEKFTSSGISLFVNDSIRIPCPLSSRRVWRIIPTMVTVKPSNWRCEPLPNGRLIAYKSARWWWLRIFFIFTSIWGNDPILTNIFQMGWNHQLVGVANYLLTHPATVTSIIAAWFASEKAFFCWTPPKNPIPVDKMPLFSGGRDVYYSILLSW